MTAIASVSRPIRVLGSLITILCAIILGLSFQFGSPPAAGPIAGSLALFLLATAAYLTALALVLRQPAEETGLLRVILTFAVVFRVLLWVSAPIQEIDFYRYLWDGRVVQAGLNPYHFAPQQVEYDGDLARDGDELAAWWRTANQSEAVREIFDGVHYRGVPTAYPPAAQAVFALSATLTPAAAPVVVHILVWKAILLAFDLGTLGLLVLLLRQVRLPTTWCLAYGWCPLALKEFANSGHFDALAIFFTVLAALLLAKLADRVSPQLACGGMAALAVAVLAKSYPLILLPVALAYLLARLGWRAIAPAALFVAVLGIGYAPFADRQRETHGAGSGLGVFLTQWEMNDLLFMVVEENLRPTGTQGEHWFVLTPADWRAGMHQRTGDWLGELGVSAQVSPAFMLTLGVMAVLLTGLCMGWAVRVWRQPTAANLLRGMFLSLAWGWLLASAANPWYLLWSLPFMVFAGRRSWFLLTGLAFLYYARPLMEWNGTFDRFDYGLIWLEYVPFFAALLVETLASRTSMQAFPAPGADETVGAGQHQLLEVGG